MPIKSKAQRRKFAELLVKGEISEEVYERWNREAGSKELPERLHPGKATKKQATGKKSAARKKPVKKKKSTGKRARKSVARKRR